MGGDSIGPCEEMSSYVYVDSSGEYLPREVCLNLQIQKNGEYQ
jgi:hypothetical protein